MISSHKYALLTDLVLIFNVWNAGVFKNKFLSSADFSKSVVFKKFCPNCYQSVTLFGNVFIYDKILTGRS